MEHLSNCPTPLLDLRRLSVVCRRIEQQYPPGVAVLAEVAGHYYLTGEVAEQVGQVLRAGVVRLAGLTVCEWTSWALHVRVLPWLGQHYPVRLVTLRPGQLEPHPAVVTVAALLRHPCFSRRWVSCLHKQLGLAEAEQLPALEQQLLARRDAHDDRHWSDAGLN